MTDSELSFELLAGSPEMRQLFASRVFQRFARRLLEVAEVRLQHEFRAKVSPEDVVQSVFKSFYRRLDQFAFPGDVASLWGLLVLITVRKCAKWDDQFRAEKRSIRREVSLPEGKNGQEVHWELVAREPGPEEAAVFTELVEQLLAHFPPRQQQMLLLRVEGWELEDIAHQLQSSRRTVARVIARAKLIAAELFKQS